MNDRDDTEEDPSHDLRTLASVLELTKQYRATARENFLRDGHL